MADYMERDFSLVLRGSRDVHDETIELGHYFFGEIRRRGWDALIYENTAWFAVPSLVERFYDGFGRDNFSSTAHVIALYWEGRTYQITKNLISEVTGIPLGQHCEPPQDAAHYAPFMGEHCPPYEGGVKARNTYRNVNACARWIDANVLSTRHDTTLFPACLQIVHSLMVDPHFCLCSRLVDRIGESTTRRGHGHFLPVLVTQICRHIMGQEAFDAYVRTAETLQVEREPLTWGYANSRVCLGIWTPARYGEDHTRATEIESSDSSIERQLEGFTPTTEEGSTLLRIAKRLWKKIKMGKKERAELRDTISCMRSDVAGPSTRRSTRQRGRGAGRA